MEVSKRYEAQKIEKKIYDYWLKGNYFTSQPNDKEPYTLIMPPPNVTGVLHLGHMLNASLLDVLIRRARMQGYNACWVPGTDHASIATEAKVRKALEEEGLSKEKVSKELFLDKAWQWCLRHKDIIIDQFKKLGCSCDWNRNTFTMDPSHYQVVIESFIKLYEKGMIYRAKRMINWDPEAKTSISDEEIIYEEKQANLYFIRYKIENEPHFITVATTRPETIFGDSAICIHPEDERYKRIKNKKAIIPILNRAIPIIEDSYVEMDFGSGALKNSCS